MLSQVEVNRISQWVFPQFFLQPRTVTAVNVRSDKYLGRKQIEPCPVGRYATSSRRGEERALAEERTEQVIAAMGLPDMAVQSDELPWVPQGERVWFKPLRFDLATGRWINLLRVEGGGKVNRHRHTGGQVMGYCIEAPGTTSSATGWRARAPSSTSRLATSTPSSWTAGTWRRSL